VQVRCTPAQPMDYNLIASVLQPPQPTPTTLDQQSEQTPVWSIDTELVEQHPELEWIRGSKATAGTTPPLPLWSEEDENSDDYQELRALKKQFEPYPGIRRRFQRGRIPSRVPCPQAITHCLPPPDQPEPNAHIPMPEAQLEHGTSSPLPKALPEHIAHCPQTNDQTGPRNPARPAEMIVEQWRELKPIRSWAEALNFLITLSKHRAEYGFPHCIPSGEVYPDHVLLALEACAQANKLETWKTVCRDAIKASAAAPQGAIEMPPCDLLVKRFVTQLIKRKLCNKTKACRLSALNVLSFAFTSQRSQLARDLARVEYVVAKKYKPKTKPIIWWPLAVEICVRFAQSNKRDLHILTSLAMCGTFRTDIELTTLLWCDIQFYRISCEIEDDFDVVEITPARYKADRVNEEVEPVTIECLCLEHGKLVCPVHVLLLYGSACRGQRKPLVTCDQDKARAALKEAAQALRPTWNHASWHKLGWHAIRRGSFQLTVLMKRQSLDIETRDTLHHKHVDTGLEYLDRVSTRMDALRHANVLSDQRSRAHDSIRARKRPRAQ